MEDAKIQSFIDRWKASAGAERANYGLFLSELCDVLEVPRPDPATPDDTENAYVFDRTVTFHHADGTTSTGFIDLYKRGCFVLEAKQGVEKQERDEALSEAGQARLKATKKGTATRGTALWDEAMMKAQGQAEQYARALPSSEGRPPLLIVVDVGHSIEIFSEFTCTGGAYVPFPDPRSFRIGIDRLIDPAVRETLRLAWTDPKALDPARRTARVTREIAEKLGRLAQSLEKSGHSAEAVATFLMRALFTMFAEDVELLPKDSFIGLLQSLQGQSRKFVPMVEELWGQMKTGGFSTVLREKVLRFNGGLFDKATALPVNDDQFELLIEASKADWRDVEPAIFGTLLERALDPIERHKLGAHYTPRAYVERLVVPTIVEPLRAEWDAVKAAAVTLDRQGKQKEAADEVQRFHRRLCEIRVLDPACGSGNFLYVTLEHLKRLEGEVLNALDQLDHKQASLEMTGFTVDPHQLLGIEVNPRAAAIAELVLWIGYLQWHFRTRGRVTPPEPIIKNFHNIECRDAVLAWDRTEPVLDDKGNPVTRWDGRTMKKSSLTGEEVPDEAARVPLVNYVKPRAADWPQADFIVGNPPYIGVRRLRSTVGDEYVKALVKVYPDAPETSDYVMYWWEKAALAVSSGATRRFGIITTNSIVQSYSRRLLERHLVDNGKIKLAFAVADHPWVDAADGAAVRVAMTVACSTAEKVSPVLGEMLGDGEHSTVVFHVVERIGTSLDAVSVHERITPLEANRDICFQGVVPSGDGFKLTATELVRLGYNAEALPPVIRRYIIGKDLVQRPEERFIIDFFGLSEAQSMSAWPKLYQWLVDRVRAEREAKRGDTKDSQEYADNWWVFAKTRPVMRKALKGLRRFIVTPYTAKHRPFVLVDGQTLPDAMAYSIATDDGYVLGILSSRFHAYWSRETGGTLEDRPRYNSHATFSPFPFPSASEAQHVRIREIGDALDSHRKRQQSLHPNLTLTDLYNVLGKLRAGEALNAKEQQIHEQGLVSVLRQLHDDLDAAVAEAYGLPVTATDEEILTFLCKLNAERAAEEKRGLVRWLRPEFQHPGATTTQATLGTEVVTETAAPAAVKAAKLAWPKTMAEQAQAVRSVLGTMAGPADAGRVAAQFKSARVERVAELLATLSSLGQARSLGDGRFAAL